MTMRTIDLADATQSLADDAQQADGGPIVVTQNGQPIAVVMQLSNMDMESLLLSDHPQFLALIERSRERHQREGGISSAEMRRRLATDV